MKKIEDVVALNQLLKENSETLKGIQIWEGYQDALPILEKSMADSKMRGIVPETIRVISAYVKGKEVLHLPQALEIIERIENFLRSQDLKDHVSFCIIGMCRASQREMIKNFLISKDFLMCETDEKVICETQRFIHQWFRDQGLSSGHIANMFFEEGKKIA